MKQQERVLRVFCVAILGIIFSMFLAAVPVYAASMNDERVDDSRYVFFPDYMKISRMDCTTGSVKTVLNTKNELREVVCHGDYLYYVVNIYLEEDNIKQEIYRVKKDGKGLQKLGNGYGLQIYNEKLYYIPVNKEWNTYRYEYVPNGIKSMSLEGKKKKTILENVELNKFVIYNKHIYYIDSNQDYKIAEISMTGKQKRVVADVMADNLWASEQGLYAENGEETCKIDTAKAKYKKIMDNDNYRVSIYGIWDGYMYYGKTNAQTYIRTLYRRNLTSNKQEKLFVIKTGIADVKFVQGKWMVYKEFYEGGQLDNTAVTKCQINGKSKKRLTCYYEQ